jgi:ABC-type spermidine/putrescine transport system permease subunit I
MSKPNRQELLLTAPSMGWLIVFFALPCLLTLTLAFRLSDLRGGVADGWTWDTVKALADPVYLPVLWRTLWISTATTAACLALALPMGWCLARLTPRGRSALLLLVVLPFLTNFLIRIFAWKSLLHPEGPVKHLLVWLHLVSEDTLLLNNSWSVLVVMIYTQLPFAILPIYAAAEKFDFTLIDAARDLGASGWQAFQRIFLPGVRQGTASAAIIVFVCSLGQYVIPQFIGGTGDEMIGNKIVQRAFTDRNLPLACALAGALLLAVLVPVLIMAWKDRKEVKA